MKQVSENGGYFLLNFLFSLFLYYWGVYVTL